VRVRCNGEPAGPADTAVTRQQDSVGPTSPASPAVAGRRVSTGPAGTRRTQEPAGPSGTTVMAGRTRAASAAVAEQPPAMAAGLPGTRSPGDAVTDQRAPGRCLDGRVDRLQHLLLQVVQRRTAYRSVETVKTQHHPAATTSASMTQRHTRPRIAPIAAVTEQESIAASPAVTADAT
jgi:hypothetical protein